MQQRRLCADWVGFWCRPEGQAECSGILIYHYSSGEGGAPASVWRPPLAQQQFRDIRCLTGRARGRTGQQNVRRFSGASNAPIFAANGARGAAPRRLQCAREMCAAPTALPLLGAEQKVTAARGHGSEVAKYLEGETTYDDLLRRFVRPVGVGL